MEKADCNVPCQGAALASKPCQQHRRCATHNRPGCYRCYSTVLKVAANIPAFAHCFTPMHADSASKRLEMSVRFWSMSNFPAHRGSELNRMHRMQSVFGKHRRVQLTPWCKQIVVVPLRSRIRSRHGISLLGYTGVAW